MTRRISATLLSTPLSRTNLACVMSAIICASVVFRCRADRKKLRKVNDRLQLPREIDEKRTMKLLSGPRQPFVGLAVVAAMGVIFADCFPLSPSTLLAISVLVVICALLVLRWPSLSATYAIVGAAFFLLHNLRSSNAEGQRLAAEIGNSPRVLRATGFVISEPKIAPNGFATFLLKLESIKLEGRKHRTHASWLVRWRGTPEYGDELRLFGIAEVTAPPRNPGEFDMRSYLARRDVRRTFFVRYPEDGALVRHNGGNPILRAAQKSRAWMQNALCRGLAGSPDVQDFLNGIVIVLSQPTPDV